MGRLELENYKTSDSVLITENEGAVYFKVEDSQSHNALSQSILADMDTTIEYCRQNSIGCLKFQFVKSSKGIACSGLHLAEFSKHCSSLKPGEEIFNEKYLYTGILNALRSLGETTSTCFEVDGHLIGAGLELALSCQRLEVIDKNSKMMLPYLKIGLPYYVEGLWCVFHKLGYDLASRLVICTEDEFLVTQLYDEQTTMHEQAKKAMNRFEDLLLNGITEINHQSYKLTDRTGGLKSLLKFHMGLCFAAIVEEKDIFIDSWNDWRLQACSEGFLATISQHAKKPSHLNRSFKNQISRGSYGA